MSKSAAKKRPSKPAKGNSFSRWLSSVPSVPTGPVTIKVPVPMTRWLWFQLAEAAAVNGKTLGEVIEFCLYKNGSGLTDWSHDGYKM